MASEMEKAMIRLDNAYANPDHWDSFCESRDALIAAVREECAESAVRFAMDNFDINGLSPSALLLRDAVKNPEVRDAD